MANSMRFNNGYFEALGRSPQVTADLIAVADEGARIARSTAPVGETGEYRDGIHVEVKHQKRTVVLVVASDPKSLIIEAKTGNLVRALNAQKKRGRG